MRPSPRPLTPLEANLLSFEILNTVVKQAISLEIDRQVSEHQEYLRLGRAKIQLKQKEMELEAERRARAKKWHDKFSFYLNIYFVMAALMLSSAAVGVAIGVNVPEAVACRNQDTPCWHLRLRKKISL